VKLFAISDLHVSYPANLAVVQAMPAAPDDWLVVAGDVGDTPADLAAGLRPLTERFRQVVWAPGNHELWTLKHDPVRLRGEQRYQHLVELCRELGVLTPEDPYPTLDCEGWRFVLVPLFLLYDYSFRPDGLTVEQALAEAYDTGVVCTDEFVLDPAPYPDRAAWCRSRVRHTERRLSDLPPDLPVVFAGHYPLHRSAVHLPRIPQFAMWCGTTLTADWHRRYPTLAMVYGHTHVPATHVIDGVRFEEVSLGYPREWRWRGPTPLRQIVPPPNGGSDA
jgi:3',5'-cyclic AMP phosphodiesterase CpdA